MYVIAAPNATHPFLSLDHIKNLQTRQRQAVIKVAVPEHRVLESVADTCVFQCGRDRIMRGNIYTWIDVCMG